MATDPTGVPVEVGTDRGDLVVGFRPGAVEEHQPGAVDAAVPQVRASEAAQRIKPSAHRPVPVPGASEVACQTASADCGAVDPGGDAWRQALVDEEGHRLLQVVEPVVQPPLVDQGLAPHAQCPGDHLALTFVDDRAQELIGARAVARRRVKHRLGDPEPQAGAHGGAQGAARLLEPAAGLDELIGVQQHPPQPERHLRGGIEFACTDPEVEDPVKQGGCLVTPGGDLRRLGERLEILDGQRFFGVCRGVLGARLLPPGGPVKLPCAGQVCRGHGIHASSMAPRTGDG